MGFENPPPPFENQLQKPKDQFDLSLLGSGQCIRIKTQNSTYDIKVVQSASGEMEINFVAGEGVLVGQKGYLNSSLLKVGEGLYFGNSGCTSKILSFEVLDAPEVEKPFEQAELDKEVRQSALFMERLDRLVESIEVASDGKITLPVMPSNIESTGADVKLEAVGNDIINRYEQLARGYAEFLRGQPGVLDAQTLLGAVVITFDSSKSQAPILDAQGNEVAVPDPKEKARGRHKGSTRNYLGLITVDLNPSKRSSDGVVPTISAIHELHHHTLMISDAAMQGAGSMGMHSHMVSGSVREKLLPNERHLPTDVLFSQDAPAYQELLGREFIARKDVDRIRDQRDYLDELYASFLQRKESWFSTRRNVYRKGAEGKHWELVGDHPEDIEATKRLLGYMQGFYSLETLRIQFDAAAKKGGILSPIQQKLVDEFADTYRKCGSLIGTSRVVIQSERLIGEQWRDCRVNYAKIVETPDFNDWMVVWEKGHGVNGLRDLLGIGEL